MGKKSFTPNVSLDFAIEQPKSRGFQPSLSLNARNQSDFMGKPLGVSDSAPQLPASLNDVVYVRKSLLSPEQLQVAAATEQAIRAHETLRSLRSKAMSQSVADSHTTHAPV